jgi:hypothetical protein
MGRGRARRQNLQHDGARQYGEPCVSRGPPDDALLRRRRGGQEGRGSTDADCKRTTAAEKWTVAATAHHVPATYEPITHIIKTIAAGKTLPHFTRQMLDEMNAQHAKEFAGCTKQDTITLHQKGAATAAAAVRDLSDAELAKTGTVFTGVP